MLKNENAEKKQQPRIFELWDLIIGDVQNKEKEKKEERTR